MSDAQLAREAELRRTFAIISHPYGGACGTPLHPVAEMVAEALI
ncbi:hypothetical protein [Vreelandella aquamarina]|nr:hypothetical protein [Halomonas axialensis]